jgi:hypothetical protein
MYYQHNPDRISACPLTVHALLHIAPCIKATGPVWCYWAFPMERYCGVLQPAIRNRRFPFASLDRHVLEEAQLTQVGAIYDKAEELSLKESKPHGPPRGSFEDPACKQLFDEMSKMFLIISTRSNMSTFAT